MNRDIINEYREKVESVRHPQTPEQWKKFNKLADLADLFQKIDDIDTQIEESATLAEQGDLELSSLAKEDIVSLTAKKTDIQSRIEEQISLLEQIDDERDDKNVILEIRAGTGGEEAALFSSDLFRMYSQYAQKHGYDVEILSRNISENGGLKEIIANIKGEGAFGKLKHESGVHRVQRIPTTESSGRIHTSTASVAVMPEAESVDVEIEPEDIQIDTYRSSGAGGQHVNKTESAIRITHKSTGIIVTCQENRSQLKNRETAMSLLRSTLYEKKVEEQQNERDTMRRGQIGSAMRSEKIRTYNFPQSRVTDHRLKRSWHDLDTILNGEIDDIISAFSATPAEKTE
jgi:peptide chain release factor 1